MFGLKKPMVSIENQSNMNLQPHSLECPGAICRVPRVKPKTCGRRVRTTEESLKLSHLEGVGTHNWCEKRSDSFRTLMGTDAQDPKPCFSPFCCPFPILHCYKSAIRSPNGTSDQVMSSLTMSVCTLVIRMCSAGSCGEGQLMCSSILWSSNRRKTRSIYPSLASFTWRMNFKIAWESWIFL